MYAINKYGYPPKISDYFKAFEQEAKLGFRYIELEGLGEENTLATAKHKEEFKNAADNLGLKFLNFSAILPGLVSLDNKVREKNIELFERSVEIASYLGCETVMTDSYSPPLHFIGESPYAKGMKYDQEYKVKVTAEFNWQRVWDALVDSISRCNQIAKKAGLKTTVEPRLGEIVSNSDGLLRLLEHVNDTNLGVVLDVAHMHPTKEILALSVEKLGKHIFSIHIADNDGMSNKHLPVGQGTVDWDGIFMALKKHNFDGQAVIDIENVPNADQAYADAKKFLEEMAQKYSL